MTIVNDLEVEESQSAPEPDRSAMASQAGFIALLYVGCFLAAVVLSAVLVQSTGGSATEVFGALLDGSFRAKGRWGQTLGISVPLILVGLGTVFSGRAGLINIGQEGQLYFGCLLYTSYAADE